MALAAIDSASKSCKFSKRYLIVLMVFVGYTLFFGIHANVGMALVAMTSSKNYTWSNGTTSRYPPEYDWNSMQKAAVISSLSYGRLLGAVLAVFVGKFGGSTSYFLGIICTGMVVFCMPFFMRFHFWLFVIDNALTGTFEGISYTSVPQIWSRWAPPNERAKMVSISFTGLYFGTIASFLVAGWILYEWGWETLFHVTGTATFLWACIWYIVVKNDPADDNWISKDEKNYIKEQLQSKLEDTKKLVYPWKEMMTSSAFWITCLGKFSYGFGITFMMMYLPQYVQVIGYISMIPQICAVIANPAVGYIFDYLRSNKILSLTNIHKLYACIGFITGTITFLVACLWTNFIVSMICMVISQLLLTCTILQSQIVVLDLAPRYASCIASVAMFWYNLACIFTPLIVGFIVTDHSRLQWSICFIIFSAVFTCTALIYLKFLTVKLQPWANYHVEENSNKL